MCKKLLTACTFLTLVSCGGGGGSGSTNQATSSPTVLQGIFIDSPVMGLAYSTATQSGITDSSGTFSYLAGETVNFSLGGIEFGSATGSAELTPLNLVGADSFDEATESQKDQLINILILLQSLDADQNPDNGIDLADLNNRLSNESIDFEMPVEEFTTGRYLGLIIDNDGRLVERIQALNHFFESTDTSVTMDLPTLREQDLNGDQITDIEIVYEYEIDGSPKRIITTSPLGVFEDKYEYYSSGALKRKTVNLNSFGLFSGTPEIFSQREETTLYEYDQNGRIISINIDPETNRSTSKLRSYDKFGRLVSEERKTIIPALLLTPFPQPDTPAPTDLIKPSVIVNHQKSVTSLSRTCSSI